MGGLSVAVARAARRARLHELAGDLNPALAAMLARTKRMPGEQIAEAITGLDNPSAMFAALAPHVESEPLVRAARSVDRPRARASAFGALLGVAPELADEMVALAQSLEGDERLVAVIEGFPHLSANAQASVLPALAPQLARAGYAASLIARGVRPEVFRIAWEMFPLSNPHTVWAASVLLSAAHENERAVLRTELVARVCAGGELEYSAIRELLPNATGGERAALVDRAFAFRSRYGASNIASAIGDAIAEPEIEARFIAILDQGQQDYPWDLARAYADVAARRSPNRDHCLARAVALLDRMLDPAVGHANPYPMATGAGRISAALEHQVNALLAVTGALDGEPRTQRELQVLAWLEQVCPEYSRDDLVPIAWIRTVALAPERHRALIDIVATIEEDSAAFDALSQIAADPQLESLALDVVTMRIDRRAFPDLAELTAAIRAPAARVPPRIVAEVAPAVARRIATPEEIEQALGHRVVAWRITELEKLALVASASSLRSIDDPFVAAVANILLLDAPATGVIAKLDALLAANRRLWESYCRAARALAPRLTTSERVASIKTMLGMRIDIYPLPDLGAVFDGLDDQAWPAIANVVKRTADASLPATVLAAALARVPPAHAAELASAVLRFAPRPPLPELCAALRELTEPLREDLAIFIANHPWASMSTLVTTLTTCASVIADADERNAIAEALGTT